MNELISIKLFPDQSTEHAASVYIIMCILCKLYAFVSLLLCAFKH